MNQLSADEAEPCGVPLSYNSAAPCKMPFIASVMTIGGKPNATIPAPLSRPISAPSSRISGTAHNVASLEPLIQPERSAPDKAIVQGIERSNPPVKMTAPCPSPNTAANDARISSEFVYCAGDVLPTPNAKRAM